MTVTILVRGGSTATATTQLSAGSAVGLREGQG
jgi:hypothetical protein